MKIKVGELKQILHAFKDETEVTLTICDTTDSPRYWLRQFWGNHDGRYTITCPFCHKEHGIEIYPSKGGYDIPGHCTFCGIELKKDSKGE